MEVLRTNHLSKTYGSGRSAVMALKDVDLTIKQGEFVAVVGASGSGKSTLLHLLGGLDQPTQGNVLLEGMDLYSLPEKDLAVIRRRKFGFVFQFFNLIPVLSVEENIMMPLLLDNHSADRAHVEELISLLNLKDRRNHVPGALSGGQQQRVSIARALANKPSVLFADEPTGNLDSKTGQEVLDLLMLSNKRYHQTIILVTHDIEAAALANRILTVEDGCIKEDKVVRT